MKTSESRWNWILTGLFFLSIFVFVLAAILPGRPFWFGARKLLYFCLILSIVKSVWGWRIHGGFRFLEILPFLWLFLFSIFGFSRFPEYSFGVDDAHYYSYMPSAFLDGDLDLSNEYQMSGLAGKQDAKAREERTPAGFVPNVFPVGLAVFWTPFFLFAHVLAIAFDLPQTGFSRVYTHIVGAGNLLYACAGLYFCFRLCSLFFRKSLSLVFTAVLLFTTPYLWLYFRSYMLTSEPLSLALIAGFFWFVDSIGRNVIERNAGDQSNTTVFLLKWLLAGVFLGAMTMVRFHNCVAAIVPATFLVLHFRSRKGVWLAAACFACGVIAGFLPQLITWKILYGQWVVNMGGTFLPFWKSPFVLETLFSARKGLFPWSPIALIALLGLLFFLRRDRAWGWIFIAVITATIYINSAQADWWGATSLGSRRFVPIVPLFVIGLASFYSVLPRIGRLLLSITCLLFLFLNLFFVSSFREGSLSAEHADRFQDILTGPYRLYQPFAYGLQFPVQLAYTMKYGTPFYGPWNEVFIGEDVFYFQRRIGPERMHTQSPLFGEGWAVENSIRSTNEGDSEIYVPMFMKEKPRFLIQLSLMPLNAARDVRVDFYWNGEFLRSRKIPAQGKQFDLPIRSRDYRNEVNRLTLRTYDSQKQENAPGLILQDLNFRSARDVAETGDSNEP